MIYDVSTLPSARQVACCFSPSNFMPSWHLKVITALRLVLLPSNQPLGKRPLLGQPQLISTHSGWPPDHSRSESQVLVWLGSLMSELRNPTNLGWGWGSPSAVTHEHVSVVTLVADHRLVAHRGVLRLACTAQPDMSYLAL